MGRGALLFALVAISVAGASGRSAELSATQTAAIDAIFADYDKPGSPGCMVGVVRDGAFAYTRGYGRASLEHDLSFTTETVFDIGSTSKQFVATALLLLARDGKLALDDDVRKYLPELPSYGATVTIRHLLTHTSGLRDYITLMTLGGWQMEDVTTPALALDVISRQKSPDFQAGAEFAYSNTGFFLASLVVERASGQGLAEFARQRIFEPAGMASTRYMNDHAAVVRRRATGYEPGSGGFRVSLSNWEQLGDGAVQTSLSDLLKWDANFYTPVVGDGLLMTQLQERGRLADGTPIDYALGLYVRTHRGLRTVRHGGSWAGYRAELLRFPDARASVMVLCNLGTADPEARATRVADVVLADRLGPEAPKPTPAAGGGSRAVSAFGGTYWNADRMSVLRFVGHDRGLALGTGGDPRPLAASEDGTYRAGDQPPRYRFTPEPRQVERIGENGRSVVFVAQQPWTPTESELDAYAGRYVSDELQTRWQIVRDEKTLAIRDLRAAPRVLTPAFLDVFTAGPLVVRFDAHAGPPSAFTIGAGRARGMRFTRE